MLEKTKAFYDSLILDELTEHLKSIGIKFVEKGGNQMYHNLVFVNHGDSNKNFLFKLPMTISLKQGEKVFLCTSKGECMGTCASNSFIVDNYTKQQIASGTGAYEPLKEVVGYAQEQTGYRCIEFGLPF